LIAFKPIPAGCSEAAKGSPLAIVSGCEEPGVPAEVLEQGEYEGCPAQVVRAFFKDGVDGFPHPPLAMQHIPVCIVQVYREKKRTAPL